MIIVLGRYRIFDNKVTNSDLDGGMMVGLDNFLQVHREVAGRASSDAAYVDCNHYKFNVAEVMTVRLHDQLKVYGNIEVPDTISPQQVAQMLIDQIFTLQVMGCPLPNLGGRGVHIDKILHWQMQRKVTRQLMTVPFTSIA